MNKDKALKLALEALEICEQDGYIPVRLTRESITAIKEALAQPEQCQCPNCKVTLHASDCAVHSGPAYPAGGCDCGAQQEPVAMRYDFDGYGYKYIDNGSGSDWKTRIKEADPLYTTPPQRKPLTEYEIDCIRFGITAAHHTEHAIKLTRGVEAAHGIKE